MYHPFFKQSFRKLWFTLLQDFTTYSKGGVAEVSSILKMQLYP
jgi:hypothetical protein